LSQEHTPLDDAFLSRARRATEKVARRVGLAGADQIVLYRSRRICILLPSNAIVARIAPADDKNFAAENRELAVSRYLLERGAPVVGPSTMMTSEPYVEEGMLVSLWPHVRHVTADYDDGAAVASAARALQCVHDAFADYPDELPSYADRIEECAAQLRDPHALPTLNARDRAFLLGVYERSRRSLADFDVLPHPIHGDAHMGNVFITSNGPLWMDFEAASRGPREWDAVGAPHLPAFRSLDARLYAVLSDLRSVCVTVWCSALAKDSQKRAAAASQLERLRTGARTPVGAH
jgi:aminoglycoside phosphotransferase (APT) family kinase protein